MIEAYITGIGWVNSISMGRGLIKWLDDPQACTNELPKIRGRDLFSETNHRFGRLDTFSRVGFAGIVQSINDAGLTGPSDFHNTGLIAVSNHGCTEIDVNYFKTVIPENGKFCSPNLFAYTLPSCFLGEVSIHFQFFGPCLVMNGGKDAEYLALTQSLLLLREHDLSHIIVGKNDSWKPSFSSPKRTNPLGSVFLTISKFTNPNKRHYGTLSLQKNCSVEHNSRHVSSILQIASSKN